MWTVGRIILTSVVAVLGVAGAVALWPNVEALLTWGAFFGVYGAYLALIGWSRRRRRRGDEGGTSKAEGAEAITFVGGPPL